MLWTDPFAPLRAQLQTGAFLPRGDLYTQRPFGAFEHRTRIPQGVNADAITASMQNGVLSLIVPKPERFKPKRIEIGSASAAEDRRLEEATV